MTNQKIAAIFLILISLLNVGIWYILFNVANLPDYTWLEKANRLLAYDSETRLWFYASIVSVLLSTTCTINYFSTITKQRLLLLMLLCALQALVALLLLSWWFKMMYFLPAVFGYLAYKNALNK